MRIACLSFTDKGAEIGDKILNLGNEKYSFTHIKNSNHKGGIKSFLKENWNNYDGFIFISATGIAVRYINPYIQDKTKDPAILVIDDLGRYCISLLSGHIGGANDLTDYISKNMGTVGVITTATDGRGIESVDIFAKRNNYYMMDMKSITTITSLMVNGKKIGFYTEDKNKIDYNNLFEIEDLNKIDKDIHGLIIISSDKIKDEFNIPHTQLIPRNINIGIGCRRGVEKSRIIQAIEDSFEENNLLLEGIREMGTIEVKQDEIGIIESAKYFQVPLNIYSLEEVGKIDYMFEGSDFVKKTIGVYSVSEPVAYIMGKNMISRKSKHNGITISISKTKGE